MGQTQCYTERISSSSKIHLDKIVFRPIIRPVISRSDSSFFRPFYILSLTETNQNKNNLLGSPR